MGEVVYASFGRKTTDGGRSRIRRKRDALRDINEPITVDDLRMDHADPAYCGLKRGDTVVTSFEHHCGVSIKVGREIVPSDMMPSDSAYPSNLA